MDGAAFAYKTKSAESVQLHFLHFYKIIEKIYVFLIFHDGKFYPSVQLSAFRVI